MDQDDLSRQLNSFSISSGEEKITKALHETYIASTPTVPSIFSTPSPAQQPSVYSGNVQNKTHYSNADTTSDWDPSPSSSSSAASHWSSAPTQTTTMAEEDDGWGEGPPSYTSISQGTYFGFNSILEAPNAMLAHQSQASTNTTAFSRFRNTPVTFASAATEAAATAVAKNSDIPKINQ